MELQFYNLSLILGGVVNILMAFALVHNNFFYKDYNVYQQSRLFTAASLAIFGIGFLLHAHFEWRTSWPAAATALSVTYFHIGGTLLSWSHTSLLNPNYMKPFVFLRDVIALLCSVSCLWAGVMYVNDTLLGVGIGIFFVHVVWMSVDFFHTYYRVSRRLVEMQLGTVAGFVRWMLLSCFLIIGFGIGSIMMTALFPTAIWPYTILLSVGMLVYVYIFYSIVQYGRVIDPATNATEDVAEADDHNFMSKLVTILLIMTASMVFSSCYQGLDQPTETARQVLSRNDSVSSLYHSDMVSKMAVEEGQDQSEKDLKAQNELLQQRSRFTTGGVVLILGIGAMLVFIVFNGRWNRRLEIKNQQLQRERNVVVAQNKQLAIERDRAEAASKAKTAFIQSMTHEIRTPLNSISGFSQVLTMPGIDLPESERVELSMRIQESTQLLTNILDDLIQISDLESRKELAGAEESNVGILFAQACDIVHHHVPESVVFSKECTLPTDMVVNTHPRLLLTALTKLLHNAAKFTQEGSIEFSLTGEGDKLHFSVKDTGPGIPADKKEFIFERFAKLDSFVQGTGLGLTVARLIAERLGGTLTLDTNYTDGAKFDLIVPIA